MNQESLVEFLTCGVPRNAAFTAATYDQFALRHDGEINAALFPESVKFKSTLVTKDVVVKVGG